MTCSHSGILTCGPARLTTAIDQRARGKPRRSRRDLVGGGVGVFGREDASRCSRRRLARASPSNTMKRQGASLPWSGTREATVSSVSSSAGVGPGPVISIGLIGTAGLQQVERVGHAGLLGWLRKGLRYHAAKPVTSGGQQLSWCLIFGG